VNQIKSISVSQKRCSSCPARCKRTAWSSCYQFVRPYLWRHYWDAVKI